MKKTPKMIEVEERIGEPIDVYLRREYVDERMSAIKIGEKFGVSDSFVRKLLRNCGIETRKTNRLPEGFTKPTKEELGRMYVYKGMGTEKIAEKFGVSHNSVCKWLIKYGIEVRDISEAKLPKGFTKPNKQELKRMYVKERMSSIKIAEKLGVGNATVRDWLKENEIKTRDRSEARLPEGVTKPTKEELERMYIDEGMSIGKMEKKLGVSKTGVFRWLKEYDIERIRAKRLSEGFTKPTKEELEKMYIDERMSTHKIGEKLRVNHKSVNRWLKKYE